MNDMVQMQATQAAPTLELRRDYTGARLARVMQHPDVRKWIAPYPVPEDLDPSVLVSDLRNVLLMCDTGGALFVALDELGTSLELHTQFLPEGRGRPVVAFMHQALEYVFTHSPCVEVVTKVPVHNHAARALAHHFRFDLDAVRADSWRLDEAGATSDIEFYGYRWSDWIRHSPLLAAQGATFHTRLDSECERLGLPHAVHASELWHDRVVGATLATAYGGHVDKALILYNRWARFAGYTPVRLVTRLPMVVEFTVEPALRLVLDSSTETFEVVPPTWAP